MTEANEVPQPVVQQEQEAPIVENGAAEQAPAAEQDQPMESPDVQPAETVEQVAEAAPAQAEEPVENQVPAEQNNENAVATEGDAEPAKEEALKKGATTRQRSGKSTPARPQPPKLAPKPISKAKKSKKGKGKAAPKKSTMTMYGYWRSGCSWRVRLCLALKGFTFGKDVDFVPVHLVKDGGEQKFEAYSKLNPAQLVPTLIVKDKNIVKKPVTLTESMAICEFLEESYPSKRKLLPKDPVKRFQVRRLCEMINAGLQPPQNLSVLQQIGEKFGADHKQPWAQWVIVKGFTAFEQQVESTKGKYCLGNIITLADTFLPAMVYNAERQNVDMTQFPNISSIMENLGKIPEFVAAHPSQQPDAQQ